MERWGLLLQDAAASASVCTLGTLRPWLAAASIALLVSATAVMLVLIVRSALLGRFLVWIVSQLVAVLVPVLFVGFARLALHVIALSSVS